MAERLPTELDGVVLIEPEVHGDERGFLVETWRAGTWRELELRLRPLRRKMARSPSQMRQPDGHHPVGTMPGPVVRRQHRGVKIPDVEACSCCAR